MFTTPKLNEKGIKEVSKFTDKTRDLLALLNSFSDQDNTEWNMANMKLEEFHYWGTRFIASIEENTLEYSKY